MASVYLFRLPVLCMTESLAMRATPVTVGLVHAHSTTHPLFAKIALVLTRSRFQRGSLIVVIMALIVTMESQYVQSEINRRIVLRLII